ncbi:MAG: oligosaccharide repeat unit polymerase [Betaproteobacteria bacterium]|nr:oligosaccharide repeat unit polymerase [Betaproteobacteria bacterium]
MKSRRLSTLLFIPSAYGFVAWGVTLLLYSMRWIDWHPSGDEATPIFAVVMLAFAASATVFFVSYSRAVSAVGTLAATIDTLPHAARPWHIPDAALWFLQLVGLFGLGMYLREILEIFEGFSGLLATLVSESSLVRQAETGLVAIYLSYFGWMAIPLTILRWRIDGRPPRLLLVATALQIAGNLLYIDRTRPVWIMFVAVLVIFPFVQGLSPRRLAFRALTVAALAIAAFYAIGLWVGKTGEGFSYYGHVGVNPDVANLYYYLTSGFSYFEALLETAPAHDFVPQRSLYPLFKMGAMLGFWDDPPSQVLPFVETPFPANVGTFLEPMYSDGGLAFVWVGIAVSSFGVDYLALWMLRSTNPYALFCWANLCFVSFISFFVPKLVSTPIWLFLFIAALTGTFRALRPRPAPYGLSPDEAVMANIGGPLHPVRGGGAGGTIAGPQDGVPEAIAKTPSDDGARMKVLPAAVADAFDASAGIEPEAFPARTAPRSGQFPFL